MAEQLGVCYGVTPRSIEDGRDWGGPLGYIRAGFMAAKKKALPARYEKPAAEEPVALVFPVWAGNLPPVVRTFVQEVGKKNIICLPTSLGSTLQNREGFAKVIDLVGKEVAAPKQL